MTLILFLNDLQCKSHLNYSIKSRLENYFKLAMTSGCFRWYDELMDESLDDSECQPSASKKSVKTPIMLDIDSKNDSGLLM